MKDKRLLSDATLVELAFLRAELVVAATMCNIALAESQSARKNRHRANARKAYDAVQHFLPRVMLTPEEAAEIKTKLLELKSKLQLLGDQG